MQTFRVGNEVEIKATNKFASPTVENLYKFAARSTSWLLILSASLFKPPTSAPVAKLFYIEWDGHQF
jgi:hypothetical protein